MYKPEGPSKGAPKSLRVLGFTVCAYSCFRLYLLHGSLSDKLDERSVIFVTNTGTIATIYVCTIYKDLHVAIEYICIPDWRKLLCLFVSESEGYNRKPMSQLKCVI